MSGAMPLLALYIFIAWTGKILTFYLPPPPYGATAPSRPGPHYRGFTITLRHTPQSVGLLWSSDQPVAETCI
jgi:hypothetical protein